MEETRSNEDSSDNSISDFISKIIFVGDEGTGKTSIIKSIIGQPFVGKYEASIGIDFSAKYVKFNFKTIKIRIWDTAGQEKYKGLIPSYLRNSSIVFLVYDVSNRKSFENIVNWINFIRIIEKTFMVLCGNKIDLNREVEKKEGEDLAKKEGLLFFECSAKINENIKFMFYSSIVNIPNLFNDEFEKEERIKELMEENVGEEFQEGEKNNENEDEIYELKRELEEEKDKNKKLQDTINELKNTINKLKIKNKINIEKYKKETKAYTNKIEIMNNDFQKLILENKNLKEEINKINKQNITNKILKLYEKIEELNEKIEELNEKIKRYPFILKEGERMFSIIFASASINYSMICKNTDTINKLEDKLYQAYPELYKTNNFFLYKGTVVDKFKKFEELHLKNGDIVIINQNDN